LPPTAPPIFRRGDLPDPSRSAAKFNLEAQRYQTRAEQDAGFMQPMNGRFGPGQPLNGQSKNDQFWAHADRAASGRPVPAEIDSGRSLTQVELKKLADHEVVLLIDRSGSMSSMDCPTGNTGRSLGMLPSLLGVPLMSTSRWNWCLQQTSDMARQTQGIYDRGITMVLFSSGYITIPNVTMDRLPQIFSQNSPAGGTNLADPLAIQIGEYFRRREMSRGNVKPLIIGIITDGCPNNRQAVVNAIVEGTHLMHKPQEVTIIFFMIGGMDIAGERFVRDLSVNLLSKGASFPIVKEVSFSEMQQMGLAKAIAQNLQ
jgi:hypothetical protein